MLNPKRHLSAGLHAAALLLLAAAATFHVPFSRPLTDPFQEAEYAMYGSLAKALPNFRTPVLIHGGIDVLPSRVAARLCAAGSQIVCVRKINLLLQFGTSCLFVALILLLGGAGTLAGVLATVPGAAVLWLYGGAITDIVSAQQGSPSVRDAVLMAGLLLMAWQCRRLDRGSRLNSWPLLAVGALAVMAVFWVYNRGLVLIGATCLFAAGLAWARRSVRSAVLVSGGATLGAAVVLAIGRRRLFVDTLWDIDYWARNQAIWHIPFDPALAAAAAALLLATIVCGAWACWSSIRAGRPGQALIVAILAVVSMMYAVQSLNRPDVPHIRWMIWPASVMMALLVRHRAERLHAIGYDLASIVAIPLLATLCIEPYSDASLLRTVVLPGLVENARSLSRPTPTDRDLAGPDLDRVADLVAASGRCTFAANNAGIVHLLARAPLCSRFPFAVYVAADQQAAVIADLEAQRPDIIFWGDSAWWTEIDGRGLRERTPQLSAWIEAHYPVVTTIGRFSLRSRATVTP